MANVNEQALYEETIYELAVQDPVAGGPDGVDNLPHKQLANRTKYLKTITDEVIVARGEEENLNARLGVIDGGIADLASELLAARGGETNLDTRLDGINEDISGLEADLASGAALWTIEDAIVAKVSTTRFTVLGDKRSTYHEGRALFLDQSTDAYCHILEDSTYSSGDDKTTVTITGATIDDGLAVVKYGQAVNNAPKSVNVPVGTEMFWPTETPPEGWLEEDGSSLVRATYPVLFAVIGTMYGTADSTHFNLPDARGRFPRIWDHTKGNDPDRASRTAPTATGATITAGDHVGTNQSDEYKSHVHSGASNYALLGTSGGSGYMSSGYPATGSSGGNETRPINTNRMLIIKAY